MSSFTDFIRALESDDEAPAREAFDAVWSALRRALVQKLKQRSLWTAPPSYLGIYGRSSWSDESALEELLADCYEFVFIHRLRGMRAELEVKENIDGLVFRNVSNFLYELQKRHDPLGFRMFIALRTAVRRAVEAGILYVLRGRPGIGNETVLGFSPSAGLGGARSTGLEEQVKAWGDDLVPDLITADGKAREAMLAVLEEHLCRLRDQGVEAFRFKSVIDPLKADVRQRWGRMWDLAQGEWSLEIGPDGLAAAVRLVHPDPGVEEWDTFDKLVAGVTAAIDRLEAPERTRVYLHRLWRFLRSHAAGVPAAGVPAAAATVVPAGDKLPSRRKLAKLLGIPRDRLAGLFETLQRLVEGCRAANFEKPSVSRIDEGPSDRELDLP